jgi:hypothetical protein
MPNALDTYLTAVQKFQQFATASMDNLIKAREAYEGARGASSEIRQILSSQDDALGSVMTKLQESVSLNLVRRANPTKANEKPGGDELPDLFLQLKELESVKATRTNETPLEEKDLPALLRPLQESESKTNESELKKANESEPKKASQSEPKRANEAEKPVKKLWQL